MIKVYKLCNEREKETEDVSKELIYKKLKIKDGV